MFRDSAVGLEAQGDDRGAVLRWEKVVEIDPDWQEGWCRLGEALARLDRLEEAQRAWRQGPWHPRCVEAQGRAWLDEHPAWALESFEKLSVLTSQEPYTDLLLARALARIEPNRGAAAIDRYLRRAGEPTPDLVPAVREVAGALDDPETALALYTRASDLDETVAADLAEPLLELQVDVRATELMGATATPLTGPQRRVLDEARAAFGQGRLDDARALLEQLADRVARSPDVWATLADVREAQGDIAGAEAAIQLARTLDPLSGDLHARASEILAEHYGYRFDEEALAALDRALDVREDPALLERHARLAMRAGRPRAARRSLERLVELGHAETAGPLLADLDRERPAPLQLPPVPPPEGVDPRAWRAVHRARVYEERARLQDGDWDRDLLARAEASADEALALAPDDRMALHQRARLHALAGERADAIALYRRSLDADRDQPEVLGRLAKLLALEGDPEADATLLRAAGAGSPYALVELARRDVRAHRYLSARQHLDRYFRANSSSPWHDEAVRLREHVRTVSFAVAAGGVALALTVLLVPLLVRWRRRRGLGLLAFIERHPRSLPEVARLLSSIRHEVIKHNISSVPALVDRVEAGEAPPAAWVAERLFGGNGAVARFRDYTAQLEGLAARAGERLNLRHRDPVFAEGIRAMDGIAALEGRVGARTLGSLARHADVLVGPFYERVGTLLEGVCVVSLDRASVEEAWAAVVAEAPHRAEGVVLTCEMGQGARIRIARADLLDILVNLLRNALEASAEEGRTRLGVRLDEDEDFVTGLVRVEIRVCDDVEKRLTTAMIRGRYIDRGLGIAVDLSSRAGGSIHVEPEDGWKKAVVVRLPMEERA
ncbi:MAG: tetratricopeptide repeat protein [Alphaproteobacteria bacterium]|nr:tetratricopeptide repeat protein [Alphaproteobacteria bacterium]MCB9694335.1 tetratricopeptide repeat protein [Alphaproteobacteria bacterium]